MKYAVEMGLAAMIYIPSFIKIGSAYDGGGGNHRQYYLVSLLLSLQNKEVG
jgi:hypothetical protein